MRAICMLDPEQGQGAPPPGARRAGPRSDSLMWRGCWACRQVPAGCAAPHLAPPFSLSQQQLAPLDGCCGGAVPRLQGRLLVVGVHQWHDHEVKAAQHVVLQAVGHQDRALLGWGPRGRSRIGRHAGGDPSPRTWLAATASCAKGAVTPANLASP